MALWLNKRCLLLLTFTFIALVALAQSSEEITPEYKDYKTTGEFNKFHKRAKIISAWQINKLKQGALVVRLKTNKTLIESLKAQGNLKLAEQKAAEMFIINKNTMSAYINNFNFCKLYFIYSSGSDSLLKGVRSGIFLDTNLRVNPALEMKESFYMLAERDYAYNSSIGFVKEDSARTIKETGTPVREMGVVIKNRYGHQLKSPFPYYVKDRTFADYALPFFVLPVAGGLSYIYALLSDGTSKRKQPQLNNENREGITVQIKKQFLYKNLASIVSELNGSFELYYRDTPSPEVHKLTEATIPYLY